MWVGGVELHSSHFELRDAAAAFGPAQPAVSFTAATLDQAFQLASLPELSEEFCSSINFLDTRAANLANFIVSHFLRIYSLIHHPGRAGPNYINPCHCSPALESQTVNLAGKICAFDPLSMKRHHFG